MKIPKKLAATLFLITTSLFSNFDATIPVLDMNEFLSPETKEKFTQELHSALKEVGFFALINTGVDVDVLDAGYNAISEFFALPQDEKMKIWDPNVNGQRGYIPSESAKGEGKKDFKEFVHVGREVPDEDLQRLGLWKNIWPEGNQLKDPLYTLYLAMEEQKGVIEKAIAAAIGLNENYFTEMTREGDNSLRAIHYPACPPENEIWAAAHTDIVLFTILPRATADGLQVLNKQGEWVDVKVPENAFIINGGDYLENLTNGEFRSCKHRVVAKNEGYERYSIVYFVHTRSSDRLDPLPLCVERTGGVRKYANATRLELLEERLVDLGLASPQMMAHLAQSGLMERLIEVGRASPDAMAKLKEVGLASEQVLQELERIQNKE